MSDKPQDHQTRVVEDRESGAELINEHDPSYQDYRVARRIGNDLNKRVVRRSLTDEEMARLTDPEVRLEGSYPQCHAYFYSIRGRIGEEHIEGAGYDGACILIFAKTEQEARFMANDGLRLTISELQHYWWEHPEEIPLEGIIIETAGRKASTWGSERGPELRDRDLYAMIANRFGRKH